MRKYEDLIAILDGWDRQRQDVFKRQAYSDGANAKSLTEFAEMQNGFSKRLIQELGPLSPAQWSAIYELASNAERLVKGGKTFINGQDRTFEVS